MAVVENIPQKVPLPEDSEVQNLLRLKTFSKSLEDLTSETLYSKWKRARAASPTGNKPPGRRERSVSLITVPEMIREERGDEERCRKNSFYNLQQVFRPRVWSTGGIDEENENEATELGDFGNLLTVESTLKQTMLTPVWQKRNPANTVVLKVPPRKVEVNSSETESDGEVDDEEILIAKPVSEDEFTIAARQSLFTDESSSSPRQPPEKCDDFPIVARVIRDIEFKDLGGFPREKRSNSVKSEAISIAAPKRRASSPAPPTFLSQTQCKNIKKFTERMSNPNEVSGDWDAYQPKPTKIEMQGERARLRMYYSSFGCTTYAVVSQPLRVDNSIAENTTRLQGDQTTTASGSAGMEGQLNSVGGQEILKRFSRASSFSEESHREVQTEPTRRFSVQTSQITTPTARELLSGIANAAHKPEKERLRDIERAFDWVRKELADLRAQDKDIMRMFARIQAGIRHIQMDRSISETSESSYEDDYDSRSPMSTSYTYTPIVKEISTYNTFPRRASLL